MSEKYTLQDAYVDVSWTKSYADRIQEDGLKELERCTRMVPSAFNDVILMMRLCGVMRYLAEIADDCRRLQTAIDDLKQGIADKAKEQGISQEELDSKELSSYVAPAFNMSRQDAESLFIKPSVHAEHAV